MSEGNERRLRMLLAVVLFAIVVGGTVDLVLDAPARWLSAHVVFELTLIAGALAIALSLWLGWWRSQRSLANAVRALRERQAERDEWRTSARIALEGFVRAIDERFTAWGLTPAEREIALQLLKGRSHKEIAYESGRSERTVRQHAVTVYEKSGLAGRAALSAFFLGDLTLPGESERVTGQRDPRDGASKSKR